MKKINKTSILQSVIVLSFCISSCTTDKVVVPESDLNINIHRVDKKVFAGTGSELVLAHPAFAEIFFSNIISVKTGSDTLDEQQLSLFKSDEFIRELKAKTDSLYPDLHDLEKELAASLDLFQQATGETSLPQFYAFIGGLSYQCFLFDDGGVEGLGIGLDMFLGDAFPYEQMSTQNSAFSQYITRTFNKEHQTKKVMETILDDRMGKAKGNRLLDHMIHNGKKAYLLAQFVPFAQDSIIMEYTAQQLNWCEKNQAQIWSHLLREDLFYETDYRKINKLINPSPGSPGMPDQAPGRTANFIGWKIVEAFMQRHPDISVNELLAWSDNQELLDKSKYKPK